jgi:hypothetical protein
MPHRRDAGEALAGIAPVVQHLSQHEGRLSRSRGSYLNWRGASPPRHSRRAHRAEDRPHGYDRRGTRGLCGWLFVVVVRLFPKRGANSNGRMLGPPSRHGFFATEMLSQFSMRRVDQQAAISPQSGQSETRRTVKMTHVTIRAVVILPLSRNQSGLAR